MTKNEKINIFANDLLNNKKEITEPTYYQIASLRIPFHLKLHLLTDKM